MEVLGTIAWVELGETHQCVSIDTISSGDPLYLFCNYKGCDGASGRGIDKMMDQLTSKYDELRALPTEGNCYFLTVGIGAPESAVDRKPAKRGQGQHISETLLDQVEGMI